MNELRTKAWIGDAVLALFAREWILKQPDIPVEKRSEVFIHLTSNKFLSSLGEPTKMEAEIGVIYENEGFEAAILHIEKKLIPMFQKQRNNRKRTGNNSR